MFCTVLYTILKIRIESSLAAASVKAHGFMESQGRIRNLKLKIMQADG